MGSATGTRSVRTCRSRICERAGATRSPWTSGPRRPGPPDGTTAPVLEWLPRPDHPFHARLFQVGDGDFDVWIDGMGTYRVAPGEPSVTVPADAEPVRREERLWGIPAALCFTRRGDLPLHAAAIEIDGRAVLLAAPGRFGKTTLATAFLARGRRVLAEDLACLRTGDGIPAGRAAGSGGPAGASRRLRAARPHPGHPARRRRSRAGPPVARRRPAGIGRPGPVAGLVLLRRIAPEDPARAGGCDRRCSPTCGR